MTFTSVLIGDGSLVLQCAEHWLASGHTISALVSSGSDAEQWAAAHDVPLVPSPSELSRQLGDSQCDYLFSVVNYRILGPDVLKSARRAAINYHDAPLPRYAGINATSWAIMAGERMHGVTWHAIVDEIDAGDVYVQRAVTVDDNETSLTLNVKCYEAALASFAELVAGLSKGTLVPRPQDLSKRTYFARNRVPPNGGIIDWNSSAVEISRLVRALDFGPYDNTLGTAKLRIGERFFVCNAATVVRGESGNPGAVLHAGEDGIVVACGTDAIRVEAVSAIEGGPLELASVLREAKLSAGSQLPVAGPDELKEIEQALARTSPHERFWMRRLAALTPAEHPLLHLHASVAGKQRSAWIDLPGLPARPGSRVAHVVSLIAEYVARLAAADSCQIVFASPATRDLARASRGLVSEAVPFRLERGAAQRFADLVARIEKEIDLVSRNGSYQLDAVARSRRPVVARVELPIGLLVGDADTADTPAPLTFVVSESGQFQIVFDSGRLSSEDCARIVSHLVALAGEVATDPERPLSEMSLLSPDERAQILNVWNSTEREFPHESLASLVEARVAESPEAPAVTFGAETISYAELNARANRLARELVRHGAGPDVLIGLAVERSIDMLVALLAIIKSGSAYVPLDPMFPKERLAYMMEDSALAVLVTQSSVAPSLPSFSGVTLRLDNPTWQSNDAANLNVAVGPEHLAVVIYTSGSTGRPKGVEVSRRALINLLWCVREWLAFTSRDRLLAVTTISFDIAGADIWLPWLVGARTVLASREQAADGEQLRRLIEQHDVTFLQATPVTWRLLLGAGWRGKPDMQIVCTGEAMPPELARALSPIVRRLWNLYGPTETTIWSTGYLVEDGEAPVLIGRPVANTRCYVLDEHLQPLPIGAIGELYIAGAGLARGYLKRPELTAEKFVADPFHPGERMYRTGDLARYHADGNLECLGRTDHQVKIRGFRIELGEIESLLKAYPGVANAVVVARAEPSGDKKLVGYVVPAASTDALLPDALRAYLKESLPDYMVPATYVQLAALPLSANGKIDRNALPAPSATDTVASGGDSYVPPKTYVEKQLSEIWEEVFSLPRVSVEDSFFDLGGHSLLALSMMAKVTQVFGKKLPLNTLFESPSIRKLATHLEGDQRKVGQHTLVSIQATGSRPPIYWIPGGAALGLFRLRHIVTRLGPEQPVYGLGSQHPKSLDDVENVEQRAANYLELIRAVQPRGPYCIAGFCAGGRVAYEIAQRLTAEGETVAFLGMINCGVPQYPAGRVPRLRASVQRLQYQLRTARSSGVSVLGYVRNKLKARQAAAAARQEQQKVRATVQQQGFQTTDRSQNQLLLDAVMEKFERYEPKPYPGAISLFISDDEHGAEVSRDLDPRFAWAEYAAAHEVRVFPGGHDAVLEMPYAIGFAETLKAALEDAWRALEQRSATRSASGA